MNEANIVPLLEEVRNTILEHAGERIAFIAVFGSRAREEAHSLSDTDIAIKTNIEDSVARGELRMRLNSVLSGPKMRVDIVFVEDLDWEFKYRIARDGTVLLNRNDSWEEFVESVIKYYPDYHVFFSKLLDQSIRRKI